MDGLACRKRSGLRRHRHFGARHRRRVAAASHGACFQQRGKNIQVNGLRPEFDTLLQLVASRSAHTEPALPAKVGLLTFLMGIVIAWQGADQLQRFGANIFMGRAVAQRLNRHGRKSNFVVVGVFVLALSAALIGGVLWLSSSKPYRASYDYQTYMHDSVAGLNLDAPVRYRGVEVGHLQNITLAPGNVEQVQLTFAIEHGILVKVGTVAILQAQGKESYPVIKSGSSLMTRLDSAVTTLLVNLNQPAKISMPCSMKITAVPSEAPWPILPCCHAPWWRRAPARLMPVWLMWRTP